jgi:N-acetylglucosamine kinase-like BadF-type ATPase
MHVLGIDVGGSKTVCLLADELGAIRAEVRGPGANLQAAGELHVEKTVHRVMEEALVDRERPAVVCVGIAGVDRDDDSRVVASIMRRISPGSRIVVVNDALIALIAAAGESPGIVIVAGTGSIAYGRNARGLAARAGGWGHMIGDEGSGYWIGRQALAAAVREVDGRGPRTSLTGDVLAHFGVADAAGLVAIVYNREVPRANVATLGPIVQRAREGGDAVAAQILEHAADELSLAAAAVAARLEMRGDSFPFVLAGSMFRVVPSLAGDLRRRLVEVAPRAEARPLDVEPAQGAVALALAELRGGARVPKYIS